MEQKRPQISIEQGIKIMERKLEEFKVLECHMKQVNAYYKKHGDLYGNMCTPDEIERLTEKMSEGRAERPYTRAQLEDNAKNIKVVRHAINDLKAAKFRREKEMKKCGS